MTTKLSDALRDLLDHDLPLEVAVDRHFGPGYRQRTNGVWDDREAFRQHIGHLRSLIATAQIATLDELSDGNQYAERHVARMVKFDGSVVRQEVYLFAEFDPDGRFARIEEVTHMLEGAEADRGIGNAR